MRFSRYLTAFDIDLDNLDEKPWRRVYIQILFLLSLLLLLLLLLFD